MKPWERLLAFLRIKPGAKRHTRALDEPLPTGQVSLPAYDRLKELWETLTVREQEVTALTCLGYTNRQMAARLHLGPATIANYLKHTLSKYNLHSKEELRLFLAHWDFSDWEPKAGKKR